MMKKQILFFLLMSWGLNLSAQTLETSNIGSSGGYLAGTEGSLQYNIGEVIVLQADQMRAGVIQFVDFTDLVIDKKALEGISIYPNPSSGYIQLSQSNELINSWKLIDNNGRIVNSIQTHSPMTTIDLTNQSSGQYYLIPVFEGKMTKALPLTIIK